MCVWVVRHFEGEDFGGYIFKKATLNMTIAKGRRHHHLALPSTGAVPAPCPVGRTQPVGTAALSLTGSH